jgi:Cys-tRNA(Pro)/Cys-tRNA(Cys) deacylase
VDNAAVARTRAIEVLIQAGVEFALHEFEHDARAASYGTEAARALGVEPERVLKTLVCSADQRTVVAVVPVRTELDAKAAAQAVGAKRVALADQRTAERVSGSVVGGISPLGLRRPLETVIDVSARPWRSVFVSAGRRGLEVELSPDSLAVLTGAHFAPISRERRR